MGHTEGGGDGTLVEGGGLFVGVSLLWGWHICEGMALPWGEVVWSQLGSCPRTHLQECAGHDRIQHCGILRDTSQMMKSHFLPDLIVGHFMVNSLGGYLQDSEFWLEHRGCSHRFDSPTDLWDIPTNHCACKFEG